MPYWWTLLRLVRTRNPQEALHTIRLTLGTATSVYGPGKYAAVATQLLYVEDAGTTDKIVRSPRVGGCPPGGLRVAWRPFFRRPQATCISAAYQIKQHQRAVRPYNNTADSL